MRTRLTNFVLAVILVLCMMVTLLPININAAYSDYIYNNYWDENGFKYCYIMDKDGNGINTINSKGDTDPEVAVENNYKYASGNVQIVNSRGIVTCILAEGFKSDDDITSVSIPDTVKRIGYQAFAYCSNLQSIQLPDSVEEIGYDAFIDTGYYRNKDNWDNGVLYIGNALIDIDQDVKDIVVREGTTIIADDAFSKFGSNTIDTITIPKSVKYIGKTAFSRAVDKAITVSPENPYFCVENGVLYNKEKTLLFKCPTEKTGSLVLPDSVKEIAPRAFENSRLTSVVMPEGLTKIGIESFSDSSIKNLNIPSSVTEIGQDAFRFIEKNICKKINDIYYLDNILVKADSEIKERDNITIEPGTRMIMINAFHVYTASNQSIVIPDSVEIIEPYAFSGVKIKSISISGKALNLKTDTFSGKVEEITLADGVESIQYHAFWVGDHFQL